MQSRASARMGCLADIPGCRAGHAVPRLWDAADGDASGQTALARYREDRDIDAALKVLPGRFHVERSILVSLQRLGATSPLSAIQQLPRNLRLMYVHSFQSLVWNRAATLRLERWGARPVAGDLVLAATAAGPLAETDDVLLADEDGVAAASSSDGPGAPALPVGTRPTRRSQGRLVGRAKPPGGGVHCGHRRARVYARLRSREDRRLWRSSRTPRQRRPSSATWSCHCLATTSDTRPTSQRRYICLGVVRARARAEAADVGWTAAPCRPARWVRCSTSVCSPSTASRRQCCNTH